MAVSRIAHTGTGGTGTTLTQSFTTAQAPVGSFIIAVSVSSTSAAEAQSQFTNGNSGWTLIDLSGPTVCFQAVYGKVETTAGESVTITGTSGANKILTLTSYIGHDNGMPTYALMKADHADTGNQSTTPYGASGQTQPGARVMAGTYSGAEVFACTTVSYATNRTEAISGMTAFGTNPTTGTATTSLETFHFEDNGTVAPMSSIGARTCTIGGTVQNPTRRSTMIVLIDSDPGIVTKSGTDTFTIIDTSTVSAQTSGTDTYTQTDSATLSASNTVSDSATQIDSVTLIGIEASDIYSLTVENAVILQLLYAQADDTATQLDDATIAASMLLSDTLTHIDTASVTASMTLSDTHTQTDTASIGFSVSDSATQTEGSTQIGQSVDDQAVQIDDATIQFPTGIFDSATQTDSASINTLGSDSATQTEGTPQIGQTVSDTYNLTDNAAIHLNTGISDTNTLTDNASTNRFASDTYNLTNEVASIGPQVSDSATLTESATVFVWLDTQDSAFLFDTIFNLRSREPVFDDQIQYAPASAKSRKPFRVLAQNIFTKQWVHNDLPLSDELITTRVSGPGNFKGVFNTEIRQLLDLDPGLIPGATWLHVEEEGEIRQSTILQPWIDSNGEQRRQVEGVGFSNYLNQIFYQGEEWKQVQIDPADIIRYLWAHAQSFPTGNLGVVIANTKTPVRLGTEPKEVEFQDGQTGEEVAFEAGPYDLNWWEVTNLGTEFEKLCKETPIEYYERSYWNPDRTDVLHRVELGYPRVGSKRDPSELVIREGENLKQLIPEYSEDSSLYPSDVIVIGAGEGPTAIRGYASQVTGRLRHTVVLENEDITSKARAEAIARFELNRRTKSRYSIKRVSIDTTHINTPWGSFAAGDDVQVEGEISYVGKVQDFHRIIEIAYAPRTRIADCSLSPSSSFSYGAVPEVEQ